MLQDALHSPSPLEHLHPMIESISSPILDAGVLDFCDEAAELFSEPLCSPKGPVAASSAASVFDAACSATASCGGSSSGAASNTLYSCNDDESFASGFMDAFLDSDHLPPPPPHVDSENANYSWAPAANLPPATQDQLQRMLLDGFSMPSYPSTPSEAAAAMAQLRSSLPPVVVYDDDGFAPMLPVTGYGMETALVGQQQCSYLDQSAVFFPDGATAAMGCGNMQGIFAGHSAAGMMMGQEMSVAPAPEMLEGLQGMFAQDSIQMYNIGDVQMMGDNRHHAAAGVATLHGGGGSTDISGLEDPGFKVVARRLSDEERKERIHRYKKKRNERNFSKKIKYACRKTLADSRPRVRGRFAKNDELGGGGEAAAARPISSGGYHHHHHHHDGGVVMKVEEEEDMMLGAGESSEILAHITGVNSFDFNFTIDPWMPTPAAYSQ